MSTTGAIGSTSWSIVGVGEAGCRIAMHYFATHQNMAIGDRIGFFNTSRADFRNALEELRRLDDTDQSRLKEAEGRAHFMGGGGGVASGAGNYPPVAQRLARADWKDLSRAIDVNVRPVGADVIGHIFSLGGGTGNGAGPEIIQRLKQNHSESDHFAVCIWPSVDDGPQCQSNAAWGLARTLLSLEERNINSEVAIILSNDLVTEMASRLASTMPEQFPLEGRSNTERNRVIVEVIDAIISPGQRARNVIDGRDYSNVRRSAGAHHFTVGIAWQVLPNVPLDAALDLAMENILFPMDPVTARSLHLIVQVPESLMDDARFSDVETGRTFARWQDEVGFKRCAIAMRAVVPTPRLHQAYTVIVVLGGFDLSKAIAPLEQGVNNRVKAMRSGFDAQARDDAGDLEANWKLLMEYVNHGQGGQT